MKPNMKQVVEKIMQEAICGHEHSKKLCVDMLIADKNVFEQEFEYQPDSKSDVVDKLHQMAFDSMGEAIDLLKNNEHNMSIHYLKKAINSIKCKMDVKYGNSPWDPR